MPFTPSITSRWRACSAPSCKASWRPCFRRRCTSSCSAPRSARGYQEVDGTSYGAFVVPGLVMFSLLTEVSATRRSASTSHASRARSTRCSRRQFGGRGHPRLRRHSRDEVGVLGFIILATAALFVPLEIKHPFWMLRFSCSRRSRSPVRLHHRHLGRQLREAAGHPAALHHPTHMPRRQLLLDQHAPAACGRRSRCSTRSSTCRRLSLGFYEIADVRISISLAMTLAFMIVCLGTTWWMLTTGWRLKK